MCKYEAFNLLPTSLLVIIHVYLTCADFFFIIIFSIILFRNTIEV